MSTPVLYLIARKDDAIGDVPTWPMPSKIRANIGFKLGRIVLSASLSGVFHSKRSSAALPFDNGPLVLYHREKELF